MSSLGSERFRPLDAAIPTDVSLPWARVLAIAHEYEQAGRYDDAASLLRPLLTAAPLQPDALHLSGLIAYRQNRPQDAAGLIEQAIAQGTDTALFFRNACAVYERLGRYDESISAGRRAIELNPFDPHAHHNLAVTFYRLRRLADSVVHARRALSLDANLAAAHLSLAEALLAQGELAAGWDEYEWRFRVPGAPQLMPATDRPHWDGAPMQGATLLLVADQGFGDVIQFARYIPWAARRCRNLALACGPEMRGLLRHNFPGLRLIDRWEACPDFAAFCPLSGLPRLHGTRMDRLAAPARYLRAEPGRAASWQLRLDRMLPPGYRRVGIVWAGRPAPPNRSARLQDLAPIAALDRVALVSLQMGEAQAEIGRYFGRAPLLNVGPEIADFNDTAAVIEALDLVLTIDTAVGHLGGSMGKPVWLMLPYAADWRWFLDRDESPWYPSARLFRQAAPREWGAVTARMARCLADGAAEQG